MRYRSMPKDCRRSRWSAPAPAAGDCVGGGGRSWRHRARRAHAAVRTSGRTHARTARRRCSATKAAITSGCSALDRPGSCATIARRLATSRYRSNRSCSATTPAARRRRPEQFRRCLCPLFSSHMRPPRMRCAGRSPRSRRDRVISGRPHRSDPDREAIDRNCAGQDVIRE